MPSTWALTLAASAAAVVQAVSLGDVCTASYAASALPASELFQGITINTTTVTAAAVYNTSVSGQTNYPDATFDYCNVTFAYTHNGRDDTVWLEYWLPAPSNFQNRYLSTGGGGLAINSGTTSLPGGIIYGAAAGITDGGFGGFTTQWDSVFLLANGTVNWESVYMFGYQAHHEMASIGKEFTKLFFNMTSEEKLYSYYQACSEGGREGWSQVQRYADQFDGAMIGAPAIRYGMQQPNHLVSNLVEKTLDYYPSTCEFDKIINETLAYCDPLDGRTDGVVSRSDLCKLQFNLTSIIGEPYYCAATAAGGSGGFAGLAGRRKRQMGMGGSISAVPAQNGTVSAQGVAVVQGIIDGLHNSKGERAYVSYQPSASIVDGATTYNATSEAWELSISALAGEWIVRYLELIDSSTLESLDGIDYDKLIEYMRVGWARYESVLQTTEPDLTPFHNASGKIIHYHGESDNSIPPASSVHYYDSVRTVMYPNSTYNESVSALNDWYRLFLIPGAAHCGPDTAQNGPFPQTIMANMINWVENDSPPVTLNGTVLAGEFEGENQQICSWPTRPIWKNNGTQLECEYDQKSIDSWTYTFPAFSTHVY